MSSEKWPEKGKHTSHRKREVGGLRLVESTEARKQKIDERLQRVRELHLSDGRRFVFGNDTFTFQAQDPKTGLVRCWRFNPNNVRVVRDIDPRGISSTLPREQTDE